MNSSKRELLVQTLALFFFALILPSCKKKQAKIAENEYYVCSMDPQVMEKQPGLCPICKMPLTKAVIDKSQMHIVKLNNEQMQLGNIHVAPVRITPIGKEIVLSGVFTVDQNKTEQISARLSGRIEHLYYKIPGTEIRKGDKLYDLYSRELMQAEEEYLLAIEKNKLLQISEPNFISTARNKLLLWGLTEQQVHDLEKIKQSKITNTIYSNVGGILTEIVVNEGDYLNTGSVIYKVADLSALWVEAQLYTNELGELHEGEEATVTPAAYPDALIAGKIQFANPELQNQSKINLVRVEIDNRKGYYKPGMQAYVTLQSPQKKAFVLPIDAAIQNGKTVTVWIQKGKGNFEPRMVTIGIQNKSEVEITSGLNEGDTVVISGAYLVNSEFIFRGGTMAGMENMKM